jgi:hypothetical protein
MIRKRNQLRLATGVAAGAVAAVVTYYATLAAHERSGDEAAKSSPLPADEDLDVGDWKVQWIQ